MFLNKLVLQLWNKRQRLYAAEPEKSPTKTKHTSEKPNGENSGDSTSNKPSPVAGSDVGTETRDTPGTATFITFGKYWPICLQRPSMGCQVVSLNRSNSIDSSLTRDQNYDFQRQIWLVFIRKWSVAQIGLYHLIALYNVCESCIIGLYLGALLDYPLHTFLTRLSVQ